MGTLTGALPIPAFGSKVAAKSRVDYQNTPEGALVQRAQDIDWDRFGELRNLGITAGASAPELLVEEIIGAFAERYSVSLETISAANEDVFFPLPRPLRNAEAAE